VDGRDGYAAARDSIAETLVNAVELTAPRPGRHHRKSTSPVSADSVIVMSGSEIA